MSKSDGTGAAERKMGKAGREGNDLVIKDGEGVSKARSYRAVLAQCRRMERWRLDAREVPEGKLLARAATVWPGLGRLGLADSVISLRVTRVRAFQAYGICTRIKGCGHV